MKLTMNRLMLCLILTIFTTCLALAQDSSDSKSKADTRTVTGCLTKSGNGNEYALRASDGSSWEVSSSTVALSEHVGHTVSATGVVSNSTAHNLKEDAKDAAHDTGMKKDNAEHGHMKVTDLQMVSSSCQQ